MALPIDPAKLAAIQGLAPGDPRAAQAASALATAQDAAVNPLNQPVVSGPGAIDAYHAVGNRPPDGATESQLMNMINQKGEYDKYMALRNAATAPEDSNGLEGVNKILQAQNTNTKLQSEAYTNQTMLEGQKALNDAYKSGNPQLVQDTMGKYFPDMKMKYDKDASEVTAAADKHISDTLAASKTRDELMNAHYSNAATSLNAVMTSPDPAGTYKALAAQGAFTGIGAPTEYDPSWVHNTFIHATSVTDKLDMKNQLLSTAPADSGLTAPGAIQSVIKNISQAPAAFTAVQNAVGGINPQQQALAVPPPGIAPQVPQQAIPPQAVPQGPQVAPQPQMAPSAGPVAPTAQPPQQVPVPPDVQAALARHNQQAQATAAPPLPPEVVQAVAEAKQAAAPAEAQQASNLNIGETGHIPEIGAAKTQGGTPITETTVQHIMKATGSDRGRAIDLIQKHLGKK